MASWSCSAKPQRDKLKRVGRRLYNLFGSHAIKADPKHDPDFCSLNIFLWNLYRTTCRIQGIFKAAFTTCFFSRDSDGIYESVPPIGAQRKEGKHTAQITLLHPILPQSIRPVSTLRVPGHTALSTLRVPQLGLRALQNRLEGNPSAFQVP